jgi:transcriptional regulator with XRE-family HTH domain
MALSQLQIQAEPLTEIVRKAVDQENMSLSDIASRAELSVPTIARLYNEGVKLVQARTARKVAEALGYTIDLSRAGRARLEREAEDRPDRGLTYAQKSRIRRAVHRALEDVLAQL